MRNSLFKRLNGNSKREVIMNTLKKVAVVLLLSTVFATHAKAATSDLLTVTITPNASYAVDIDTQNVTLNLGTVALGATVQTMRPSTVTVQSTYASTDLRLQGSIAVGSGQVWSFDGDT